VIPRIAVWVGFWAAPAKVRPLSLLPLLLAGWEPRFFHSCCWACHSGDSSISFSRRSALRRRASHFRRYSIVAAATDSAWLPGACWSWGGSLPVHSVDGSSKPPSKLVHPRVFHQLDVADGADDRLGNAPPGDPPRGSGRPGFRPSLPRTGSSERLVGRHHPARVDFDSSFEAWAPFNDT